MPAKVGGVIVDLKARTAQFEKGMKRGRGELRKFRGGALDLKGALRAMIPALSIGAAFAGIRGLIGEIDRLAKTARKLGLLPEQLQKLQFAATQSGVDVRTLEMGIQRLVRRTGEASVGMGEGRAAIKELGLDAKKLAAQSVQSTIEDVADAIAKVDNRYDKLRLMMKLVDSEGVALVDMFSEGSAGLRRYADELERAGAVSAKVADQAERFENMMGKVKATVVGQTLETYEWWEALGQDFLGKLGLVDPDANVKAAIALANKQAVAAAALRKANRAKVEAAKAVADEAAEVKLLADREDAVATVEGQRIALLREMRDEAAKLAGTYDENAAAINRWALAARAAGMAHEWIEDRRKRLEQRAKSVRDAKAAMDARERGREALKAAVQREIDRLGDMAPSPARGASGAERGTLAAYQAAVGAQMEQQQLRLDKERNKKLDALKERLKSLDKPDLAPVEF